MTEFEPIKFCLNFSLHFFFFLERDKISLYLIIIKLYFFTYELEQRIYFSHYILEVTRP